MKPIVEFLNTKVDENFKKALKEYANYHKYNVSELIASILLEIEESINNDKEKVMNFEDGDAALKFWKKSFDLAKDVMNDMQG